MRAATAHKRFLHALWALMLALSACATAAEPDAVVLRGATMGTTWSAQAVLPVGVAANRARRDIQAALDQVVAQMSTWEPGSDISHWNRAPAGWHSIPKSFFEVLHQAMAIAAGTDGAYDPTVGPLVDAWGFGAAHHERRRPDPSALAQARARVGWRRVQLDAATSRAYQPGNANLDLSSIAKGYGVDRAALALEALGVTDYLLEVGGELRGHGHRPSGGPWHVAIERPATTQRAEAAAVIPLNGLSVATSGNYRRYFQEGHTRYAHIIDPRTGLPADNGSASVTVVHAQCMQADALATALFVLGPRAGFEYARNHDLAALFIVATDTGFIQHETPAFSALASAG
ncbi:FAD:protein FMN transferase [Allopusillimonas soli]